MGGSHSRYITEGHFHRHDRQKHHDESSMLPERKLMAFVFPRGVEPMPEATSSINSQTIHIIGDRSLFDQEERQMGEAFVSVFRRSYRGSSVAMRTLCRDRRTANCFPLLL